MRQDEWQPLVDDEEATELTMPILALAAPEDDPEGRARDPERAALVRSPGRRRRSRLGVGESVPARHTVIGIRALMWRQRRGGERCGAERAGASCPRASRLASRCLR